MKRTSSHQSRDARAEASRSVVGSDSPANDERPFHELRVTLHELLGVLSMRRWFFFVPFCITASAIFVGSMRLHREYTASTRFERRDDPVFMNIPTSEGTGSFTYFRQTLERDITAPDYMAEVVERLNLTEDLPRDPDGSLTPEGEKQRDAIGRGLAPYVKAYSRERTAHLDLIDVIYTGPDPDIGKRLVDEVKNTYICRTQARIREFLERLRDWYGDQIDEGMKRVTAAERRLAQLRLDHPYSYITDPISIAQNMEDLKRERRELTLRRNALQIDLTAQQQLLASTRPPPARVAALPRIDEPLLEDIPHTEEAQRLLNRVHEIEDRIESLRITRGMTDEHPEIKELRSEHDRAVKRLHAQLAADQKAFAGKTQEGTGRNDAPRADEWWPERARIMVAIDALEKQIAEVDTRLQINQERQNEYADAKKGLFDNQEVFAAAQSELSMAAAEVSRHRGVLNRILPVLKANDMGRAVGFSEERPAQGNNVAVSPKSKTIILAALFAGLCAGAAFTILAELVDHVYRSSSHVARSLGVTVLETIDVIVTSADRRRHLIRRLVVTPLIVGIGLATVVTTGAAAYLSLEKPAHYQRLRRLPATVVRPFLSAADTDTDTESFSTAINQPRAEQHGGKPQAHRI